MRAFDRKKIEDIEDALEKLRVIEQAGITLLLCPYCYQEDRIIDYRVYGWSKCTRCNESFTREEARDAFRYTVDTVIEEMEDSRETT